MAKLIPTGVAQLLTPEIDLEAVFQGRTEGLAIGRHESCPINVIRPKDVESAARLSVEEQKAVVKKVSRKHAVLYTDGDGNYFLENLSETNGTYINNQKLDDDLMLLNDGDEFTLGPPDWEFVMKFKFEA